MLWQTRVVERFRNQWGIYIYRNGRLNSIISHGQWTKKEHAEAQVEKELSRAKKAIEDASRAVEMFNRRQPK